MKTIDLEEKSASPVKGEPSMSNKIISNLKKIHPFPEDAIKVEVKPLYLNRWRVNVWVMGDNNAKVGASWFVLAAEDGSIIQAS